MVTLAFAQAGTILVQKDPNGLTGGEEGLGLDFTKLPSAFVGVLNTKNLYWLALALRDDRVPRRDAGRSSSSPGRVWQAIRENEQRVEVLGLRPFTFKLRLVRPLVVPRHRRRRRLPAADRRRDARGDDADLHADAARDGRDRRRRHPLGRPDRRRRSTRSPTTGSRRSPSSHGVQSLPLDLPDAARRAAVRARHALHPDRLLPAGRDRRARAARPPAGLRRSRSIRQEAAGVSVATSPGAAVIAIAVRGSRASARAGAPLLLVQGLGYARLGLGARRRAGSPATSS